MRALRVPPLILSPRRQGRALRGFGVGLRFNHVLCLVAQGDKPAYHVKQICSKECELRYLAAGGEAARAFVFIDKAADTLE